jgi:hypothetical protein
VIEYVGASNSQEKTMLMQVLPSESGVSFDCFKEPEPEPEVEPEGEGE